MPLSENEQRLLEQMEKALAAEDPKFASALRGRPNLSGQRFAGVAIALLILGVSLIVAAVAIPLMPIGIFGFLAVLASVLLLTSPKPGASNKTVGKPKPKKDDLMKRFEQRWENRNQGEAN
ncbi:MAG: DUF3040 domain-containing protein [Actinobacteria bacterium]|nr:DUF3040 domain-containing protein [Actinomycetota bacterium]